MNNVLEMDQVLQPDLTDQIAAARQAKAAVEEARKLEALANDLPRLEKERRRQERLATLRPAADQAERQAARVLAEVAPKMKRWRERWAAAHAELVALAAELPTLQGEINDAARFAYTATDYRLELAGAYDAIQNPLPNNDLPVGLSDDGFAAIWAKVGGANPDLAALPSQDYPKQQQLLGMLTNRSVMPYVPAVGHKLVGRRFA